MNIEKLKSHLELDEGRKNKLYYDFVGIPTIGVGHNLNEPISDRAIDVILEDDINNKLKDLDTNLSWWRTMDEARQLVLADMCFNLGITRLLGFKETLKAMKEGRYQDAAKGMEDSLWYKQVGVRAVRLVEIMRHA